jgi:hypothetical protein
MREATPENVNRCQRNWQRKGILDLDDRWITSCSATASRHRGQLLMQHRRPAARKGPEIHRVMRVTGEILASRHDVRVDTRADPPGQGREPEVHHASPLNAQMSGHPTIVPLGPGPNSGAGIKQS